MKLNALIIGSGAREHAFAFKMGQSLLINKIYLAPGNGGTEVEITNLPIDPLDFEGIAKAIRQFEIKLVLVGPEQPLVQGIIDYFEDLPDPLFSEVVFIGPNKVCAALEGSKDFSKQIMQEAGIPTARAKVFTVSDWNELNVYIQNHTLPVVIKADGLAAGKGVAVCFSHEEAIAFSSSVLIENAFGPGNQTLLVEEFLDGVEVSLFLLSDGQNYQLLPEAKDYKRIFDNDKGPNTGGMGAVSPVWFVDKEFLSVEISRKIKTDLGIQISQSSIHYIRSKIMPKRLAEKVKQVSNVESNKEIEIESNVHNNFKFKEPQSIDHNQEIVTFRKRKT